MIQRLWVLFVIAMIAGVVGGFALFHWYPNSLTKHQQDVPMTIAHGTSSREVAQQLSNVGVIRNPDIFWFFYQVQARLNGTTLKAGEYLFTPNETVGGLFYQISSGKVVHHSVTIPEGLSSKQIIKRIRGNKLLTGNIIMPEEGTMLPDTYEFHKMAKRSDVVSRMQQAQEDYLLRAWLGRTVDMKHINTPGKAVILASIVEKETGTKDERKKVASVFLNRLKLGMRLQSDPTIIYGITKGEPLGRRILRSEIKKETEYNTYVIDGLPPAPICHPGEAAIDAVLNPIETDYLYFVADGTGGHYFSKTLKEHNRAVVKWRKIRDKK